ncbi:riboflavin transporter FmnP [Pullulanibacillus pueri]|uniref:Riboflavin transporter n=1 Tax=Pullulanibacillus pueri TaxID=1437324 RepID=A0A8J3A120_9BACL|nr:ECF transporter S component [Pullulanibacillus pueri]MBM7680490.1 riboflavin transporter FmnP [Pullulanibacillus pueri]GGH88220.1 riboflavin transporter [Pullulanibacillus pueri]
MRTTSLKKTVTIALLSAIAFLIMYIAFPLPLMPTFLTIDLSDIPAIIGAILFGPVAGIIIEALKNLLHYATTGGIPIGELANFVAGSVLIITGTFIYRRRETMRSLLIGLCLGTLIMAVLMSIANYFVIYPAYAIFMGFPVEQQIQLAQAANHSIHDLFSLIILAVLPFNIIKGILVTLISIPLWVRLRPRLLRNS